jgi:hypothetical protein
VSEESATLDRARLDALSRRLGISARRLLLAAARLAEASAEQKADPAFRARVLADARGGGSAAAQTAENLLLTPVADFSTNEVERLFASLWPENARRPEA